MTIAFGPKAIPLLRGTIAHWESEIRDTRDALVAGGPYEKAQRRYIAECKGFIRRASKEIHELDAPRRV